MIRSLLTILLLAPSPAFAQTCRLDFEPTLPSLNGAHGTSVAVSGDRAAVGAPGEDNGDGAVYIYERTSAGDWVQTRRITPPVAGLGGRFGAAVDLGVSNSFILVVGAPAESLGAGAAYLFLVSTTNFFMSTVSATSTPAPGDAFGAAVSVEGSRAYVGAPGEASQGAPGSGAVYLWYQTSPTAWEEVGRLESAVVQSGMAFGASVGSFDLRLLVGAPGADGATSGEGAAFEYLLPGPPQQAPVLALTHVSPSPQPSAHFGRDVVLGERRLVISEPDADGPAVDAGMIHVFRRGAFSQALSVFEQSIPSSAPSLAGRFGAAISLRGATILVGHPGASRVEAFTRRPDQVWEHSYDYSAPPAATGFGTAVGIGDEANFVAASGAASGVPQVQGAGRVFVWDLAGGDCDVNGRSDPCEIAGGLVPDCNLNGIPDSCDIAAAVSMDRNGNVVPDECEDLGQPYCGPGAPNTASGGGASLRAIGSGLAAVDDVLMRGAALPPGQFVLLVNGTASAFDPFPGGSLGILCLGGGLGRHIADVTQVGAQGTVEVPLRVGAVPTPAGNVAVAPGDTWRFQLWYRDAFNGVSVSNFSDALEVSFL